MKYLIILFILLVILLNGCTTVDINKSVIPKTSGLVTDSLSEKSKVEIMQPTSDAIIIDNDVEFIQYEGGKLYNDISKNFDIVVFPVTITYDQEKHQCINYSFRVFNKTEESYHNFEAILRLDNEMEKYIHSGTVVFLPQRMDLSPKNQIENESDVWGINVTHSSVIFQPDEMKQLGITREGMIPIAGIMKLQLEWEKGSEYYEFCVNVMDET